MPYAWVEIWGQREPITAAEFGSRTCMHYRCNSNAMAVDPTRCINYTRTQISPQQTKYIRHGAIAWFIVSGIHNYFGLSYSTLSSKLQWYFASCIARYSSGSKTLVLHQMMWACNQWRDIYFRRACQIRYHLTFTGGYTPTNVMKWELDWVQGGVRLHQI